MISIWEVFSCPGGNTRLTQLWRGRGQFLKMKRGKIIQLMAIILSPMNWPFWSSEFILAEHCRNGYFCSVSEYPTCWVSIITDWQKEGGSVIRYISYSPHISFLHISLHFYCNSPCLPLVAWCHSKLQSLWFPDNWTLGVRLTQLNFLQSNLSFHNCRISKDSQNSICMNSRFLDFLWFCDRFAGWLVTDIL